MPIRACVIGRAMYASSSPFPTTPIEPPKSLDSMRQPAALSSQKPPHVSDR
ncbi:MAG: hypothetical protein Q8P41_02455 [Pseudomonadota bacterium]|nr:hypothetical protein [Pseudomonadota bacterium]